MNYQTVLLNLHGPFANQAPVEGADIAGNLPSIASAHLETIIRLYYLRHGFISFDPFLVHPLNVMGFSSLSKVASGLGQADLDAVRSTLILAAKGIRDQGQSHYICHVTLRFFMGGMRLEEKVLLNQIADLQDTEDDETKAQMASVQARWAPSILSVTDDPEAQRLGNLVKEYMELSLDSGSEQISQDSPEANPM